MGSKSIIPCSKGKIKAFCTAFYKKSEKGRRKEKEKGTMIVSAVSLFKKFNLRTSLKEKEWGVEEKQGKRHSYVSYFGHEVKDGAVRIAARFARPAGEGKKPTILLLPDMGKPLDTDLMDYFVEKGYAVLMPDYCGRTADDGIDEALGRKAAEGLPEEETRTVYPPSLAHGNLLTARGLDNLTGLEAEEGTWFEWTYVALYSIEYLKQRKDVGNIGVVGIRAGGALAWHTMLSPDVKCGIPVNAAGWYSFSHLAKFGDNIAHNLSDDMHRYIAAIEGQSYAPYAKCPVLMLCSLRDSGFDCDRAYDTYSRIRNGEKNALVYSVHSGACIGPHGLVDMDLFLEKHLKGREIYIPDTLNVAIKEVDGDIQITAECDKEGILEEAGICYAEADVKTRSSFREWLVVCKGDGKAVKNGTLSYTVKPFEGAKAVFVFAYAKYINGFRVMSKITSKRLSKPKEEAVKDRLLFSGKDMDCFFVAEHENYSVGGIFLERESVPKIAEGYGGIGGAYSVGGIKTYKISSPRYLPDENAMLKFDVYCKEEQSLKISIEVADVEQGSEKYHCFTEINGGGKWKRMILKAADFKGESYGVPLQSFRQGSALSFACAYEEKEFSITNILWL